jgi:hypothetical protein
MCVAGLVAQQTDGTVGRKGRRRMTQARFQTMRHIETVRNYLSACIHELLRRQEQHDQSKLEPPEVEAYDAITQQLRGLTYGSEDYHAVLRAQRPAIDHHYQHNRHHPEWATFNIEIWRPVVGFEGYYEVSNLGVVRSVTRRISREGRQGDLTKQGQILQGFVTPKGYVRLQLVRDGQVKNCMIHRLVAEAFLPNPENKPEVNHKDGNKQRNVVDNLEWMTSGENLQHAYDEGLKQGTAKYVVHCPEEDITTIGITKMVQALQSRGYADVSPGAIWLCINGDNATHLELTFEGTLLTEWHHNQLMSMNLIDLLELLCDWKSATLRHNDGSIYKSLEINRQRFGYSYELHQILKNTVDWLETQPVYHKAQES